MDLEDWIQKAMPEDFPLAPFNLTEVIKVLNTQLWLNKLKAGDIKYRAIVRLEELRAAYRISSIYKGIF